MRMVIHQRERQHSTIHQVYAEAKQQQVTDDFVFPAKYGDQHDYAVRQYTITDPACTNECSIVDYRKRRRKLGGELNRIEPKLICEVDNHEGSEDTNRQRKIGL